jgi:hypothetical protein
MRTEEEPMKTPLNESLYGNKQDSEHKKKEPLEAQRITHDEIHEQILKLFEDLPNLIPRHVLAVRIERSPRTIANWDSLHIGVPGAIRIKNTIYYPKQNCIDFFWELAVRKY